jgi:iron-sulfur cluster repair protein YtfE (RIC family)
VKRHPALIPLSHDHHDALVVARGLILGRATAPRSDWPPDRPGQVARVTAFFNETLEPHFEAEEQSVYPVVTRGITNGAKMVVDLLAEHAQIRTLVHDLEADPASALEQRLPALGRLIESHIRTEERVLFEAMQRELKTTDLQAIGSKLAQLPPRGPSCRIGSESA